MRSLSRSLAIILSLVFPTSYSVAAEFQLEDTETDGLVIISLVGSIEAGDDKRFKALALEHDGAIIVLDSPGGAVGPALEIGKAIKLRGYPTVVTGNSYCVSACALIWLAGSSRYLSHEARLGFHASYKDEDGVAVESGAGNALVGRYLTLLDLPSRAILFATLAPPDDFLWLDRSTKEKSGIEFSFLDPVVGDANPDDENLDTAKGTTRPPEIHLAEPRKSPLEIELAKYPKGWIEKMSSENGLDITPDGKLWLNADYYGDEVDYGVSAEDVWLASGRFRKAWVRGYHLRDTSVPYRESMRLVHADCLEKRWAVEGVYYYGADKKLMDADELVPQWTYVIPRTYAESWFDMICSR